MATVFETRLIGNIGRDATIKTMDRGVIAINFPVAHNKNWRDKRTGETKTKTTWVNCTIWKREGSNMRIVDFLTRGTMVELVGTPYAKGYITEDGSVRTEIARALAVDPKFILLDEPFAGVDPIAVEDIQQIVAGLKRKNIGILITDHNVHETLTITDRAYLLFEGRILKEGTARDLAEDEQVRRVYLGQNFTLRT